MNKTTIYEKIIQRAADPSRGAQSNAKEYAYALIKRSICTFDLPPGSLITEKGMANALNISQTPVREAFARLSQEKVLEVFSQRGTYVSKIDLKRIADAKMVRTVLEREALSRVPLPLSADLAMAMRQCLERQRACIKPSDPEAAMAFINLDGEFHRLIFTASDLVDVHGMIQGFSAHSDRLRFLVYTTNPGWDRFYEQHRAIYKALESGDRGRVFDAWEKHFASIDTNNDMVKKAYPEYFV